MGPVDATRAYQFAKEDSGMSNNRYALAGWVAIAQTIIIPTAFVIGILQGVIGARAFGYTGPSVGPSDLLMILFTAGEVYTLIMFRKLINERFSFHDVDTMITLAIWWGILFQSCSLLMKLLIVVSWPVEGLLMVLGYVAFMTVFLVSAGIINIIIGIRLLKIKESMSDLLLAYTYFILVAGIIQVSVIFSPLVLLMLPISSILLAMIFFKSEEQVEFV